MFDRRRGGDAALQVIERVISEITLGMQHEFSSVEGHHWKLKLTAILATAALRHEGLLSCANDEISALTAGIQPFGLPLFFELVKTCGWTEQLAEVLGMMERNASQHLLISLCSHVTSCDNREIINKVDISLLADMCNFLLLHDNNIIFRSDPRPPCINKSNKLIQQQQFLHRNNTDKTSGARVDSVLLTELVRCLAVARLDGLTNEHKARLFIALLNLSLSISRGRCYVMKKSVAESREFADSFEALTTSSLFGSPPVTGYSGEQRRNNCHEFPLVGTSLCNRASERVSESVLEILLRMWNSEVSHELWALLTAEDKPSTAACGDVSSHERCFLASVLLEGHSQMKQPEERASLECSNTLQMLSAKLEAMLAPFAEILLRWIEKKKDLGTARGSPEELDRAMFIIDERLKGYVECSLWLACTEDVKVISDERWLHCLERNLDVFASSPDHLKMLIERLAQLRQMDQQEAAECLKQVVLGIFARLPPVLREDILEDVYKVYEPELLFGVNSDFALQLLATFNRLVSSNRDISKMLSEVSVLALQSPDQTLEKLVSEAFGNTGQVSLLVKIIQGVPVLGLRPSKEGCSCLCAEVKRVLRTDQTLSDQQQQARVHGVQLLLQPYTSVSEADIPYKKEPILDVTEFLDACVLPHINIVPRDDSPNNSLSCINALALLRVAVETPTMQLCDWTVVKRCNLFPTVLCMCSLADVCGSLSENCAHENLYAVKEMALDVLGLLTRILSRQQSPRMEKAFQWLSQRMLRLHWTSRLYLHPLFAGCSQVIPSLARPLSAMLPASLSSLLKVSTSVSQTMPPVPGEPLVLLFEACKTSDVYLEFCLAALREDVLRCLPSAYASIVTVLVEVLPHCVSAEWTRVTRLLQHVIATDDVAVRTRTQEQDALICEEDSGCVLLALSQLLKDVMLLYGTVCCRQRSQHDKQMCANVWRGYTDMMKTFCIEGILHGAADSEQKATYLALCLIDICAVSTTFTLECSSHLQVIAQETAGLFNVEVKKVKVAEGVKVTGATETSSELKHVVEMVHSAVELVPNEDERQTLLKAVQ